MVVTVTCERGRPESQDTRPSGPSPPPCCHGAPAQRTAVSPRAQAVQGARPWVCTGAGAPAGLPGAPPAPAHSRAAAQEAGSSHRGWSSTRRTGVRRHFLTPLWVPDGSVPLLPRAPDTAQAAFSVGEPTLGAGGGITGTAPPQAPVPLASEISCHGLQHKPECNIPWESRAQPGCARHSALTPSGPCLPGRWPWGRPGALQAWALSLASRPGMPGSHMWAHVHTRRHSGPEHPCGFLPLEVSLAGTCPPRGHLGPVLSSLASPLRSLQARPGWREQTLGSQGRSAHSLPSMPGPEAPVWATGGQRARAAHRTDANGR